MKYVAIPGLERMCSQLIVGTSPFTPEHRDGIFELLDAYVENGGNTLDTSRIYSLGKSEQVLAMWMKARRNREAMVIISKCCHHYIDQNGCHHPERQRVSPEYIIEDIEESLARMQVDYFDICLLHRDDMSVPVGELMDALQEQQNRGVIKAYGVSNWSTARIEAADRYTRSKGYSGIVANSPSMSLAQVNEPRWSGCTYVDRRYAEWHEKSQLAMFPWASQASGFFTGRFTRDSAPNPDIARVYYSEDNWERYRRAGCLAKQKGSEVTANHIALAYMLQQPFPVCAVIGPQTADELKDCLQATAISLTEAERLWLNLQSG